MAGFPPEGVPIEKWLWENFGESGRIAFLKMENEWERLNARSYEYPGRMRSKDGKEFAVKAYRVQGQGATKYVASAGPTAATITAFWAMVVELSIELIIMLNGFELLLHGPSDEYLQYWPIVAGQEMMFGQWTIRCEGTFLMRTSLDESQTLANVKEALCRVTKLAISGPSTPVTRVRHVCHYRWQDGCNPESLNKGNKAEGNALQLVNLMTNTQTVGRATELLVHCRGGVERTGTLILLDICAARMLSHSKGDVAETLGWLRDQRRTAVGHLWQYVYVNVALAWLAYKRRLEKKHHAASEKSIKKIKDAIEECWLMMRKRLPQA